MGIVRVVQLKKICNGYIILPRLEFLSECYWYNPGPCIHSYERVLIHIQEKFNIIISQISKIKKSLGPWRK
jgi:hypothetical protein